MQNARCKKFVLRVSSWRDVKDEKRRKKKNAKLFFAGFAHLIENLNRRKLHFASLKITEKILMQKLKNAKTQNQNFADFNSSIENFDIILQTLKNEKWTQRRYHSQFATKFSPQKVFDIKIRIPGADNESWLNSLHLFFELVNDCRVSIPDVFAVKWVYIDRIFTQMSSCFRVCSVPIVP